MAEQQFRWDPAKYVEFGDYRSRPFFELTSRIAATAPARVVDLGCGPGNLTATLAARWPDARVLGLDSSPEMVAAATSAANLGHDGGTHPGGNLTFAVADIRAFRPRADTDVVVSNAALQWVPGHLELMAGWLASMNPGAWLAVQVPGNFGAPSHVLMRELAESAAWRKRLDGVLRHANAVAEPGEYHELLLQAGAAADVWETTYSHLLAGARPVLDWVRGTGLRPVLAALSDAEGKAFEDEYQRLLEQAYPYGEFGTIFEFRRIFMVARKDEAREQQ
ncbi:trans-aconitate 2-methyltransferase [Arthrobacter sp. AQ5-05]|uniref:trans-aconitate 2-methyltransferase n=1 Tax=Arthrobacter sp. AQ5-05 TaxID=2184581 RepID=UPI0012B5A593|nr:trans-aconitate 2-methyltransferase [Arthrobacter sp. AQ5-05]